MYPSLALKTYAVSVGTTTVNELQTASAGNYCLFRFAYHIQLKRNKYAPLKYFRVNWASGNSAPPRALCNKLFNVVT